MNSVFADTSGFYSVLDDTEQQHAKAAQHWNSLVNGGVDIVTTSYVVCECAALVQRRLGLEALGAFLQDMLPVVRVVWSDSDLHKEGARLLLSQNRRKLSLVDCVSFVSMRNAGIDTAFAFDEHFAEQGFRVLD